MYAAGQELDAMRRLEAALKSGEGLGEAALRAWGGLFDLLQVLGRRPAFDALALTFARRFEKSPPAWSAPAEDEHTAAETTGGRAHVSLSGVLNARVGEVLKQTMKLAATSTLVRMDLAKLVDADNDGATLLLRGIAALKRAKKEFVFGSPEHLAQILAAKLVPGERSNESMWLLLLELYQQAFRQDEFEEAAVNYAITFEVSPPSWEALPERREEAPELSSLPPPKAEGFSLHDQLLGAAPQLDSSRPEQADAQEVVLVLHADAGGECARDRVHLLSYVLQRAREAPLRIGVEKDLRLRSDEQPSEVLLEHAAEEPQLA